MALKWLKMFSLLLKTGVTVTVREVGMELSKKKNSFNGQNLNPHTLMCVTVMEENRICFELNLSIIKA